VRAACFVGNRTFEIVERSAALPGPGQVDVEVAFAGICGTDLHAFHGAWGGQLGLPAVLGHEMSGTVAATGEGVPGWGEGDRVTVNPLDWCGACAACAAGHTHICHSLRVMGYAFPGAMQSRVTVPARSLVRLPDGIDLELAALVEPTAVAVHDIRRAGLQPGERVLVVGGGPIGVLIALVARAQAADVVLVELSEERRRLAASLGLRVLDPASEDVATVVDEWTGRAGVPVAFEVSGSAGGVETALQALAVRGRLIVVAIHGAPPPVDLYRVFQRELSVIGARVYEQPAFDEAVRLLAADEIPARSLISSVVPLDDVAPAFESLEQGRGMKILLDCSDRLPRQA
jgi:(R,R)-butanediol dehydrogenase/meso-butanediol dehydrogenase/diacetyl reductase